MKKWIALIAIFPHFAYAEMDGLGFLKIGEQKAMVQKSLKLQGAKLMPTSYEEQPHPSMQPLKYENVKLTKYFHLDDVELFFHNQKLFQIYVESNPSPVAYNASELATLYGSLYRFENVVDALKEKYTFVLDKTEEKILKSEESNCDMDLLVKQTTWKIPTKEGLEAIYFEQRIYNPKTKVELESKALRADSCYESPFNAIQINNIAVRKEVDLLMDKAIEQQKKEQILERQNELKDL